MHKKKSLLYIFTKLFVLVIVIPIFAIAVASHEVYRLSLVNNLAKKASQNTDQLAFYLNDTIEKLRLSLKTLSYYNDAEIPRLIADYKANNSDQQVHTGSTEIEEKLSTMVNYFDCVEAIIFFYQDGGYYYYKSDLKSGDAVIRDTIWYKTCLRDPQKIIGSRIPSEAISDTPNKFLSTFSMTLNRSGIEVVSIVLNDELFRSVYDKTKEIDGGAVTISDYNGSIISSSLARKGTVQTDIMQKLSVKNSGYFLRKDGGTETIVTFARIAVADWILINFSDSERMQADNVRLLQIFLAVFATALLLFLFVSYKFMKNIAAPIKELSSAMKTLEGGNFEISMKTDWGSNEFDGLTRTFMNMSSRIGQLISEIDKKEKTKRKLEIQALQYQMNPHFVRNTLNSIRLLAMLNQPDKIIHMSEALSNLLSSSIENDSIFTDVSTELTLLRDYVYIMQIRYTDQFVISYNIDDNVNHYQLLKKTLQPIVENSIFHGVASRASGGVITISGYETSDVLIFEVYDNGEGMTQEVIQKLSTHDPSLKSIGLFNTMERIRLNYGEGFGLSFESKLGEYTKITVRLPKIEYMATSGGE